MYMTVRRCSAPRIVKFECRYIITVDFVHNLALLAGLLIYLHSFTHALAHAYRLTLTHINNHTIAHSLTVTHMQSYTHNHHIDTQIYTYTQHTHSPKNIDIQYTHTHAYTNTLTIRYNHTLTYTHTQHTNTYTNTHIKACTLTRI